MKINKSIDIEEEVRTALAPHLTVYCRPLPAEYGLPNILVTQVGGTDRLSQHGDGNIKSSSEGADDCPALHHS